MPRTYQQCFRTVVDFTHSPPVELTFFRKQAISKFNQRMCEMRRHSLVRDMWVPLQEAVLFVSLLVLVRSTCTDEYL